MKLHCFICCFAFLFASPAFAQKDWIHLFDGKTLSGWKQLGGSAVYQVENGVIAGVTVLSTPNSFLVTEKEYSDFVLELDVFIPDTTSNSGIQFRSHFNPEMNNGQGRVYGLQYELDASARAWTGGIYDEGRRGWLYPLDLNAPAKKAYKRGVFNHVKIECIGNTVKTWVNNIPTAYLVDTADTKGFIALQVHSVGNDEKKVGKKIYWKNIRIKTTQLKESNFPKEVYVVNHTPNALTKSETANGWRLLFNGIDAQGWKGAHKNGFPENGWKIENGIITVIPHKQESNRGGDIITLDRFGAFDLSFDFKLTPAANSGLKYFVTTSSEGALGLEYQVLDDKLHPDAKNGVNGNRTLASLYDLIPAKKPNNAIHAIGEWNKGRIIVYPDNRVEHYLNGQKVLSYIRGSQEYKNLVALSKYKNYENFGQAEQGYILLQDHGDEVSFRSIKIKELK